MRVWKKVPGVDCLASEDGKIRLLKPKTNKTRNEFERPKYFTSNYCYKRVRVHGKQYNVHRLVAAAFHGPCPEGLTVDHIDNNSLNNHANNLRYITRSANSRKACLTNPHFQKKFNKKEVLEIRKHRKRGLKIKDLAYIYNTTQQTIIAVTHFKGVYFSTADDFCVDKIKNLCDNHP